MFGFSVFLLSLLATTTACNDTEDVVKTFLQTKIDRNVDPCSDFYAHVCPVNLLIAETVPSLLSQFYIREAKKFQSERGEFTELMQEYIDEFSSRSFRKTVNDLLEVCDVDKSKAVDFASTITQESFYMNKTCEEISYEFGILAPNATLTYEARRILKVLKNGRREIEFSKSELAQLLNKNEKKFFEIFKDEVRNTFSETPWLNYRNGTDFYLDFLKNRLSLLEKSQEVIRAWEMVFEKLKVSSQHCKPNNTIPSFVCAFKELENLTKDGARPASEFGMFGLDLNAVNYILTLTDNMARLYGGYGNVIGHEMMHTFYSSAGDTDLLKYYFTNSSQCVTKQFAATCKEFGGNCIFSGTATTEEEDGSDLAAIRLVYSDFEKRHLHNEKSDIEGITTAQMYFYSFASTTCTDIVEALGMDDVHSGWKIRVNALMSQMDEFKEAFQCAGDSRMIRSKVEHCSIFGSDAPQTRKHFNSAPPTENI
ncbi:unnamed protein product [Caenorhabditis auriculariae]|uniref:Peptidase M13 C-terminal domain-containing protein n=1 Tax=Caenorhabditis auriculariae TaxID=2777116 RepID=A0A8S1H772_9PELO|nr:unnamed protein product [Caenorhabditis auriculariae]